MRRCTIFALLAIGFFTHCLEAQNRTVGLMMQDAKRVSPGYSLLAPKHNGRTYLMDNYGQVINTWDSKYEPGQSAHLLPNGHLLRAAMLPATGMTGGGEGGRLEEYDWDGNLVWEFEYATKTYALHHDIKPLPNGNVISLLVERKEAAEAIAAGFNPSSLQDTYLAPDAVVEIEPIRPKGGRIVWEWHVWDHLIQNFDPSKQNYGVPNSHPELINPNATQLRIPAFWNHMNSIDYNPVLDQILLSVRGNSEVWVIDHSTTKAEAAGHAGGRYGKGGDLLYRWGNPQQYGAGKASDEILYQQHDAQWIEPGSPGAGNMLVFNNGVQRPGGNLSSLDEFVPPLNANGTYAITSGSAYGPSQLTWTYAGLTGPQYYESDISGAQRLLNGNTLACYGTHGVLVEVTQAKEIVWQYVNPVVQQGPLQQGQTSGLDDRGHNWNAVFRIRRYPPDFAGLKDKDLTPKGLIETYPVRYVNGASFQARPAAAGAIMSAFGDGLASTEELASTTPPPTRLGGVSVEITDSAGATQPCRLFYASPKQINLLIPDGVATGLATLTVKRDSGTSAAASVVIEPVMPGLFAANANGSGVGAITALRVGEGGARSDVPVSQYDTTQRKYLSVPIDLGAATDQVYLSLYGTGIRGVKALSGISVTIGGTTVPVAAAAAHTLYSGLDQVNAGPLPRTLVGKGEVGLVLKVDGRTANTVTVNIK